MLIRIGTLSERTGVSADALRAWERRYGLPTPRRTAGGFRQYDEGDVAHIQQMTSLIAAGLSAGDAARHLLQTSGGGPMSEPGRDVTPLREVREALDGAFRAFDEGALASAIDLVLSSLDLDTAIRDVFLPALRALGDDWVTGRVSVAQEHFSTNILRGRLMGLARGWDRGFGPRSLLACPPGEYHDVSLILFGLALRRRGWRITFLGADTPMDGVIATQRDLAPDLTVLFTANWTAQMDLLSEVPPGARSSFSLAGSTAGIVADACGCRWLKGDPVSEAEAVTNEFAAQGRLAKRAMRS